MESIKLLIRLVVWGDLMASICHSETIRIEIYGDEGYLQTPNYPASYPFNCTTLWSIRGPSRTLLQLNFTDFHIESNKKCLYDFVTIGNDNGEWTRKYCGDSNPPGYTSINNNLYIMLVSDKSTSKRGFKARWKGTGKARTVSPTPSSNATNCNRHHTITVTDKACSDAPKIPATVTSCHCPSMTSTVARFAQSSSSIDRPIASSSAAPVTPVKPQLPGDTDLGNNSVTKSCLQERGRDLQGRTDTNGNKLVVILAALAAVLFLVDIILVVLLCRRCKRRNQAMGHSCRTELPPIELKIVDGKIISSPRAAGHRVKFSDKCSNGNKFSPTKGRKIDRNENERKDRGIDLLKNSRYVDNQESSRLMTTHHGEL